MKTLVISSAQTAEEFDANHLQKNLGDVYQLSLISSREQIAADPEAQGYIARQIAKAKALYGVEKVVHFE